MATRCFFFRVRRWCKVTEDVTPADRAQRTGQKFGDMKTDNDSVAMQGIVGFVQPGVDQSFGSLTTTNNSGTFQGQMEVGSLDKLFGR